MASQVEVDPQETREWLEALDAVVGERRPAARAVPAGARRRARAAHRRRAGTRGHDAVPEHDPAAGRAASSRRRGSSSGEYAASSAGTRSRRSSTRTRRAPSSAGTSPSYQSAAVLYETGFNHFWNAPSDRHGGDLVFMQGHSSPGVYARAFLEGRIPEEQMRKFRMEVGGGGLSSLPAPVADAGLLAVPHRLDGPRPADGDLPGPLHEVPAGPRPGRDRRAQGLGLHGRRRDGRARVPRRDLDGRPRAPRQPDLRHQLQPAAPRRPGPRQRQDHPGARDELPRRGLERHQGRSGARAGTRFSRTTTRATCSRA